MYAPSVEEMAERINYLANLNKGDNMRDNEREILETVAQFHRSEITSLRLILLERQEDNEKLKEENYNLKTEVENLTDEKSCVLYRKISDLKEENEKLKNEIEEVKKVRQLRFNEVCELKDRVVSLKSEIDRLRQINEYKIELLKRSTSEIERLNEQGKNLNEENEELSKRIAENNYSYDGLKLIYLKAKKEIKKLKTPKPKNKEFKVGDRVMVRPTDKDEKPFKGTIANINLYQEFGPSLEVRRDDKSYLSGWYEEPQCTRLVKKKPEFKVGDRVVVRSEYLKGLKGAKGEIIKININTLQVIIDRINMQQEERITYTAFPKECAKLRKAKAKECGHEFAVMPNHFPCLKGTICCHKCKATYIAYTI